MKGIGSILATLAMVTISVQARGVTNLDGYLPVTLPAATAGQPPVPAPRPPVQPAAIFVFGDGWLDVGNNNDLQGGEIGDPLRANHPYYGIDFPGGKATGRFSNGYNIADIIAKAMGFEMSPPAYRSLPDPSPTKMEGFTGVNYASGLAGILYSTYTNMTIPLPRQVSDFFASTRTQLRAVLGGRKELSRFLSKSLFLVGAGSMDLVPGSTLFFQTDGATQVRRMVGSYNATLAALHAMGARRFAVVNAALVGCLASVQSSPGHGGGDGPCDEDTNRLAAQFNAELAGLLAGLQARLHRFRYSLADFYGFTNATFANPSAYGFTNTNSACCPDPCARSPMLREPCSNRSEYWFWDGAYCTEQAAKLAAAAFYSGSKFTTRFNFRKLIAMKG